MNTVRVSGLAALAATVGVGTLTASLTTVQLEASAPSFFRCSAWAYLIRRECGRSALADRILPRIPAFFRFYSEITLKLALYLHSRVIQKMTNKK